MRHGQTAGNVRHCYAGHATDDPLTAEGRAQAYAAGVHPEVERVLTSPLSRARETAAICFPEAEQVVEPAFAEMDFGDFEGLCFDELDDARYRAWVEGGCVGRCPNGETRDEFGARVARAFEYHVAQAVQHGERQIVVVAHGGTLVAAMDAFAHDARRTYFDWQVPNCCGWSVEAALAAVPAESAQGPSSCSNSLCFSAWERFENLDVLGTCVDCPHMVKGAWR